MTSVSAPGTIRGLNQRRLRIALFLGLVAAVAIAILTAAPAWLSPRPTSGIQVLVAARDIRAGSTISSGDLMTANLTTTAALQTTFLTEADRARVIGQTAAIGIPVGHALPNYTVSQETAAGMWAVNIPIRRMPSNITDGSHVALLVTDTTKAGEKIEHVFIQDVTVLHVGAGSADLWLPPRLASQVGWYADSGGIVLFRMEPGAVVTGSNLAAGGPPQ